MNLLDIDGNGLRKNFLRDERRDSMFRQNPLRPMTSLPSVARNAKRKLERMLACTSLREYE
jgi:hypothetical protein